jgi:anaerobic magnesium-protoporphyrin IX monomethyl ester cyclase
MDKRICLVIPPAAFLLSQRVFVYLGILKVAAVLEKAGWKVEMLDLSGISNFKDVAVEHAKSSKSKIFGFTATTAQVPVIIDIVDAIKEVRPEIKTILGGPHVAITYAAYKAYRSGKSGVNDRTVKEMEELENSFDTIIAGDGEKAIFEAVKPDSLKIIDADDIDSNLFLNSDELNSLPFPARHLIDINTYEYAIDSVPALSLISQLGCPFNCSFCGGRKSPMLRKTRERTPENVVEEMVHMYKTFGRKGFMFYDDELNVSKQMTHLMNLITVKQKELGVRWRLRGFIKSHLFTEEQAKAMYDAGFRWILVGFESGSPKILEAINKRATCEHNTKCIEIAHKYGLKVKALMSIGHPGESVRTIKDTEDWVLGVKPDDVDFSLIAPFPGTAYYDHAVFENGVWVYTCKKTEGKLYQTTGAENTGFYKGKPGQYKSCVYTDQMSSDELVSARDEIEDKIRRELNLPFNPSASAIMFEHSMGQIPSSILRTTDQVLTT